MSSTDAGVRTNQVNGVRRCAFALVSAVVLLTSACRYGSAPAPAPVRGERRVALPAGVSPDDYKYIQERHLLIPVANAKLSRIPDSFEDARDGQRRHQAVDIM